VSCHRVIKSNGVLGGFTPKGGAKIKEKILKIEELNK
jgi:O6-methylguanine-DNA--protein-cysteine methyltransferase